MFHLTPATLFPQQYSNDRVRASRRSFSRYASTRVWITVARYSTDIRVHYCSWRIGRPLCHLLPPCPVYCLSARKSFLAARVSIHRALNAHRNSRVLSHYGASYVLHGHRIMVHLTLSAIRNKVRDETVMRTSSGVCLCPRPALSNVIYIYVGTLCGIVPCPAWFVTRCRGENRGTVQIHDGNFSVIMVMPAVEVTRSAYRTI